VKQQLTAGASRRVSGGISQRNSALKISRSKWLSWRLSRRGEEESNLKSAKENRQPGRREN
jgi:hypothetical protein